MSLNVLNKDSKKNLSTPSYSLVFNPKSLIRWLFRISGILVICHLINVVTGAPSWNLERLFHLEFEGNIPTWFSSILWFIASIAAYQCSQYGQGNQNKTAWIMIAAGFLVFSIDEVAQIHEVIFAIINKYFYPDAIKNKIIESFKATNWSIIAAPFLILVVIWLFLTLRKLLIGSPRAARLLALGFFIAIFGAFVLETTTNFLNHGSLEWVWVIEATLEEWFEMIGAILIIAGLFAHHRFLAGEK